MSWLPPNINSAYGGVVDKLYYLIMAIVAVMFFLTEGFLIFSIIKFRRREGQRATYLHGSNKAEIIWTVLPGALLVWLALYQADTWDNIRVQGFTNPAPTVMVQGFPEQFAWHFRLPGPDGSFGTKDDIAVNDLHVPVNEKIAVYLSSKDVIHSFFIPHARVKMDSVPGMLTRTWFQCDKIAVWNLSTQQLEFITEDVFKTKKVALRDEIKRVESTPDVTGQRTLRFEPDASKKAKVLVNGTVQELAQNEAEYQLHYVEIACAELCGLGHTKMRTVLTIEPRAQFDAWLVEQGKYQDVSIEKWNGIWDKQHPEFNGKP